MASKQKKYKTSYSDDLKERFPFIRKCSTHIPDYQHKYHCTICNVSLSLAYGGANDIARHAECPSHEKLAATLKGKVYFNHWILFCGIFINKYGHFLKPSF